MFFSLTENKFSVLNNVTSNLNRFVSYLIDFYEEEVVSITNYRMFNNKTLLRKGGNWIKQETKYEYKKSLFKVQGGREYRGIAIVKSLIINLFILKLALRCYIRGFPFNLDSWLCLRLSFNLCGIQDLDIP